MNSNNNTPKNSLLKISLLVVAQNPVAIGSTIRNGPNAWVIEIKNIITIAPIPIVWTIGVLVRSAIVSPFTPIIMKNIMITNASNRNTKNHGRKLPITTVVSGIITVNIAITNAISASKPSFPKKFIFFNSANVTTNTSRNTKIIAIMFPSPLASNKVAIF